MSAQDRLQDWAYAAGWSLVRRMPEGMATSMFNAAADLAARRNGPRVRQLRRNLARVVPQAGAEELDELVRGSLRSYARFWRETFRLPGMDREEICRKIDEVMVGRAMIDDVLSKGKGLILALPHTGNWEASGVWLATRYGRFTTVVERLRPESLYRRFVSFRESLGMEILPANGTDFSPYRVLIERLRANGVVCLPADRDLTRKGIPVTFFGEETRMPAGPARLAALTGATILIVGQSFTADGWGVRVHSPIVVQSRDEIPIATQRMADGFAADIAVNPVDWHMLQKLWIADLPDEKRKVLASTAEESA